MRNLAGAAALFGGRVMEFVGPDGGAFYRVPIRRAFSVECEMQVGDRGVMADSPTEGGRPGIVGACGLDGKIGTVVDITRDGTLIVAPDPPSQVISVCVKPDCFKVEG